AQNDEVKIKRSMLTKTASALKKVAAERDEAQKKLERYQGNLSRLFKLASMNQIEYEDIPEFLERLSEMSDQEQDLELRVMEKAASRSLLNLGEVGEKTAKSTYSDPLTELIMTNAGF